MRIVEAAFEIERVVLERGRGIEQVDCTFCAPNTVMASVYVVGDETPLDILIDLAAPVSEASFDHRAFAQALLGPTPVPPRATNGHSQQ